jgi:hypothetical protein
LFFWYWKFGGFFKNLANFLNLHQEKIKKSHVFPIFLAKDLNWPVCYMAAAFSKEPTHWNVEVQVQIPSNSRSCKWQTLVLTCVCVQSLSKKLGSFFCLSAHPLGTQEESQKAPYLMPIFFQKNLTLQKQILWKSNSNLEGFFMGKSIQGFLFLNFPLKSQWQAFKERQNILWQRGLCSLFHASCYFWHFSHGLFRS